MRLLNDLVFDTTTVALALSSAAFSLDHMVLADLTATITGANPTAKVFTAADTDILTTVAHGYATGMKCQVASDTTLPAGLTGGTDYYAIVLTADTFKLAVSQANALAGTAVDVTDAGTGVHTLTPTATIAGSIKLQKNDQPDDVTARWVDITSSSQNFTATIDLAWALVDIGYRQLRAVVTVTSGTVTAALRINAKGG